MAQGYNIMRAIIDINKLTSEHKQAELTILEDVINTQNPSSISIERTEAKTPLTIGETCGSSSSNKNSEIKKGRCIDSSKKERLVFTGMNTDTGKLLYITEWYIKYSRIESKCISNCFWFGKFKCNGHDIDDFINSIEKHVKELSQVDHKNLVSYDTVICLRQEDGILVRLAQEFIEGTNLFHIRNTVGWNADGIRIVAKAVLEAINFLHTHGIVHGYINDKSVFLDNFGQIRCRDFSLIPHLNELVSDFKQEDCDLAALGGLLKNLMSTLPDDIQIFVHKCELDRTISAFQLLNYPFEQCKNFIAPVYQPTHHSRIKADFEILEKLAKGAFGVVFKILNHLDKTTYALKKIPVPEDEEQYKRMKREVELLCQMAHENVVRYFYSWIRNVTPEDNEDFSKEHNVNQTVSSEEKTEVSNSRTTKVLASNGYAYPNLQFRQVMCIQMEFCEQSTIRTAIETKLCSCTNRVRRLFKEILEGLKYIHSRKVVHRDLKPENIFLNSNLQVKIGDFGLSIVINSDSTSQDNTNFISSTFHAVGTRLYMAPELLIANSQSVYTEKIDMYALGIVFFEMCNPPFTTREERKNKIQELRNKDNAVPVVKKRSCKLKKESPKIIQWLLHHDPDKRPSAEQILDRLNIETPGEIEKHIEAFEPIISQFPKVQRCLTHHIKHIRVADHALALFPTVEKRIQKVTKNYLK